MQLLTPFYQYKQHGPPSHFQTREPYIISATARQAHPAIALPGDSNAGTSASTPKQSIAALQAILPVANGDTVAFCKGGYWVATSQITPNVSTCMPGKTCVDFRDYASPKFASFAKPIIFAKSSVVNQLWNFDSAPAHGGGVRIFNLHFENNLTVNYAIHLSKYTHDVWFENNTSNNFIEHIHNDSNFGHNKNIHVDGNTFTNASVIGYLGASDNSTLNYNYWSGNGGDTAFNHTIYISSGANIDSVNHFTAQGNYIEPGPSGNRACVGAVFISHGGMDYMTISDNYIYVAPYKAAAACYGISFTNVTTNANPVYFRHSIFSGNTIVNGGALALYVTTCPGCVIENNTIIMDWPTTLQTSGMSVPGTPARAQDDLGINYSVRNNTIYFGPNVKSSFGSMGVRIEGEGTGHVIANNAVYNAASSGYVACFIYPLTFTSYSFINNNNCYGLTHATMAFAGTSTSGGSWVELTTWLSKTKLNGFDTNSITKNPLFTNPTNPTYNFLPRPGSPLIGAGNAAHASKNDALGALRTQPPAIGAYE